MNEIIDYSKLVDDFQKKAKIAVNESLPGVVAYGTYTNLESLEKWSNLWTSYVGVDSPYQLYKSISKYEKKTGKKTSEMIKQWEQGTLSRNSEINDWINSHFLLEGYSKR